MCRISTILLLALALACAIPLGAQNNAYRFSRLDITQGLSHNQVNCFLQDERGFLWVGTMSGLDRYDAHSFKVFKHDLRDSASINDDYIERILEGPGHRIWVFTREGINIYDPLTEKFDRHPERFLGAVLHIPNPAIVGTVLDIQKDQAGHYWFLTMASGIYRYDPLTRQVFRYAHQGGDPASPHSDSITSITAMTAGAAGDWWLVSRDGILERMDGKSGAIVFRTAALRKSANGEAMNFQVYVDRERDLWIYAPAYARGVFYYDAAKDRVQHFDKARGKLNTNIVNGIVQDEKGLIWVATDHGGVNLLDKRDLSVRYILNKEEDATSLSQNCVNSLYRDKDGIIWVGTYKKGVSYHYGNIMKFPLYRRQIPGARNTNYDDINQFTEDNKGNLWIGTNGGGLIYFNRQTGKCRQYLHDPTDPNSLTNDVIVSLCIDHEQQLWIGTYFGGLDRWDGKVFHHYRHDETDTNSISDDRVWELMEDRSHRLWVGTFSQGLDLLDRRRNRFIHHKPLGPNSVISGYVTGLTEDRKGNLWIATAYGVDVLEKSTGLFRHFGHDDRNPGTSLSNNNTFGIREDSRGLIWIPTREGLDVFDPSRGIFTTYRKDDGLPDNTVLTVLEDSSRNLWVSTPNGLSNVLVSRDSVSGAVTCGFRNYDESDGLQGKEFNQKAAFKTSKGEMLFGGAFGFNLFYPGQIRYGNENKPVVLTDLQVFNKSLGIGEAFNGNIILGQALSQTKEIVLRYNENVFSVAFASLDFSNPEKVRYSYMLEGFNKEWLVSPDRKATFTNLDPGSYIFKVRTGDNRQAALTLAIRILPPFWKTPLAYTIYGLVLIALLLLARQMTIHRARLRFAIEQEREKAQRLHELDMMKIQFFTNVSHEFRTPLSLILAPLDRIIKEAENPGRKEQFRLIHRNARRLLNLVSQLLDFRKMEEQELQLNRSDGEIIRFIRELSYSFMDIAGKKHIDFSFSSTLPTLYTSFDQDKLERIVFNLLSNAFKFTSEYGKVSVALDLLPAIDTGTQGLLRMMVSDTGIGITKENQSRIFDRFFQDRLPSSMINQGSGIGLAITREFVKLHQGSIEVESEPGAGSRFIVLLPAAIVEAPVETGTPETRATAFETREAAPEITAGPLWGADAGLAETTTVKDGKGRPLVLVVEDNEDLRFFLKENLEACFTVAEAANGLEGWKKALSLHPDMIVSDISMPVMNGIELCRKIKSDKRTAVIPVILLTALAGEAEQLDGLKTGANDYLTKPFNMEILLSRIKNLLAQQEQSRKTWQKQLDIRPEAIQPGNPDETFLRKALAIVEKNMANPDFSVDQLSKELFISRVGLYKRLLTLSGMSPIVFIRSMRLKKAAMLLEKTDLTVAEAAYQTGFNNPKYFSRYFREAFGMVPSAYQALKKASPGIPSIS